MSVLRKSDRQSPKRFGPFAPWIAAVIFLSLFFIAIFNLLYESKVEVDHLVSTHIQQLEAIFQKIDQKCKILSFSQDKNYIDFLTVKEFSGSQVGPIMLMFPEKWEGPYIKDNPAIQEKLYQLIKAILLFLAMELSWLV